MIRKILCTATLLLAFFATGVGRATDVVAQAAVTRMNTVSRGTPAYEDVRQFILKHSKASQHASLDNVRTWPVSFTIASKTSMSAGDFVEAQDISGPPTPLPPNGNIGDTITISACSRGISESWSYAWGLTSTGGYGWVLQDYHYQVVNKCKDAIRQ